MADHRGLAETQGAELRLSHVLAVLHFGGIAALIAVVIASVAYISTEHNALARHESERLVDGGTRSLRLKLETVTKDYAVWDEAYEAVTTADRDWLYRNIGTGVLLMGTPDMIVLIDPAQGLDLGWVADSPETGEANLLPPPVLAQISNLLHEPRGSETVVDSGFFNVNGEPWAFAGAYVHPFDGNLADRGETAFPIQIHGRSLSGDLLEEIGIPLGIDDLAVVMAPQMPDPALAHLPLWGPGVDPADPGAEPPVAWLVWTAPQPGADILRRIAWPLGIVLTLVAGLALATSGFAVRAAQRLERALVAAQAADRMKTEFLSNVSHELRTPMNGIIGVAQLLQMTDLDAEQRELIAVLSSSADLQMSLISDLLDLTRIESGNRALTIERFEPAPVLREIVELVRPQAREKSVEVEADVTALADLAVLGDARAFRQVVTNLLGNAVKFTDEGRITLDARVERHGSRVALCVAIADTGRGISEENQRRIFDRFFQVDGSNTRDKAGTGLGLAISESLVRMMGGRIDVESALGTGSTFTLHLAFEAARRDVDGFQVAA